MTKGKPAVSSKNQLDVVLKRVDSVAAACERMGGHRMPAVVKRPCTPAKLRKVERAIGAELPASFRAFVTEASAEVSFGWFLPEKPKGLPRSLKEVFGGNFDVSLDFVVECEKTRKGWVKECFPEPKVKYNRVWRTSVAFAQVDNGDMLAFGATKKGEAPVIYLSHDHGEGHGRRLADSFTDLLERWSPLGFPGCEDWQWLPFCDTASGLIDPAGPTAKRWLKWLGV